MKTSLFTLLVILLVPAVASAHGLQMFFHVNGSGNLESNSMAYYGPVPDPVDHHDSVFLPGAYTLTGQSPVNVLQFTASPTVAGPTEGIANGSTWGFDLVGPLKFWDPTNGIVPTDVSALVVRSGVGYSVDKNSTFVAGGNLATGAGYAGTFNFHSSTTVNIPLGSPEGLYVVGYQLRSTGSTPYGPSNTFYAIGINGLSGEELQLGLQELAAIGVPEPSSMALAGLGIVGVGLAAWRKRSARRS